MISSLCAPCVSTTVRCRVAGAATLRASADEIALWRKQPVVVGSEKLPVSFLRNAEDQTVLALQSVLSVMTEHAWHARSFADWGVITGANFFGRVAVAQTVQRFQQEGAWGVSPHSIPHQSLHAPSGTISLALKMYGPNFGVNGGPNAAPDSFLLAAALLTDHLPGLWIVMTAHETECIPSRDSGSMNPPACLAIALALTPAEANESGRHLTVGLDCSNTQLSPDFQLASLGNELSAATGRPTARWRLSGSHWLELDRTAAEVTP